MKTFQISVLSTLLAAQVATAQSGAWGQCGGNNWTGATTCVSGYTCTVINDWYHQCVPGSPNPPPVTTTTTTRPSSTMTTTTRPPTTTADEDDGCEIQPAP